MNSVKPKYPGKKYPSLMYATYSNLHILLQHHHHLFTGEFQDRISDIASTILLHPETHAIEDPGVLATPLTYTLLLKEVPDAQHKVEVILHY